jgi:hypothetical protein
MCLPNPCIKIKLRKITEPINPALACDFAAKIEF